MLGVREATGAALSRQGDLPTSGRQKRVRVRARREGDRLLSVLTLRKASAAVRGLNFASAIDSPDPSPFRALSEASLVGRPQLRRRTEAPGRRTGQRSASPTGVDDRSFDPWWTQRWLLPPPGAVRGAPTST